MLKTEINIHTDEVIHRARAPTVALANKLENLGFALVLLVINVIFKVVTGLY